MLSCGLAASVVLIAVNWSHDARFHDECYLATDEWTAHKVLPVKPVQSQKNLSPEDFLVAVDKAGKPIDRPIAVFTEIRLPGEDASFILSKRIGANLAALDVNGYSLVMLVVIACVLSIALIGLVLIWPSQHLERGVLPWLFGAAPIVGFALAKAHFYLLYVRPWDAFTKAYYIDAAAPQLQFPVLLVGVILGTIAATCAWALRSEDVPASIQATRE